MLTWLPGEAITPACGAWEMTLPAGTESLGVCATITVKPTCVSCASAAACELPTTLGTATGVAVGVGLPTTSRSTEEPFAAFSPAAGD